jgi:hypothetical protein
MKILILLICFQLNIIKENITGRLYAVNLKTDELIIRQYQPVRKIIKVKVDHEIALNMYYRLETYDYHIIYIYGTNHDNSLCHGVTPRNDSGSLINNKSYLVKGALKMMD